jgi:hypothetical protein
MDNFDTSKWLKNQYLEEAGLLTEAGMPSPNFFYAMHKILANFLDEKAIKAGDRMSYFSAEFPLSTAFESYMRKQLEGTPINEAEDIPSFLRNLAQELKGKYPELRFSPSNDKIEVIGSNSDKQDFADENLKKDWGNDFVTFDIDDDDRGYMVSITRVNRL